MQARILFFGLLLFLIAGCIRDKIQTPAEDHSVQYFPLTLGKYIVYDVDSIVFDDLSGGNRQDSVSFQIKEEVVDFQVSLAGDTLFYVHRFRREDPSQSWKLKDLWTASRSTAEATRTEENLKFIKMAYPLHFGKRWASTAYISPSTTIVVGTETMQPYEEWSAKIIAYDVQDQVGDFNFAKGEVMQVTQTNTDDGAFKRYVLEKYARNIGLIMRVDTILNSLCIPLGDFTDCIGKSWSEQAGKGYILSQVMTDHN